MPEFDNIRTWLRAAAMVIIFILLGLPVAMAQTFEQLTNEGQAAFRRGDYQTALSTRLKQLSMPVKDPRDHCFVYWGLTVAYQDGTGEMDKALKAVDDSIACLKVIADNSRDMHEFRAEAWRIRSLVLRDLGKYDEALAANDEMTKQLPTEANNITNRAGTLVLKGDYAGAAELYRRAGEGPRGVTWKRQAAWMKVRQGKLDEAIADLAALERTSPHQAGKESNMLAFILAEKHQYDLAVADLKKDEDAGGPDGLAYAYQRGYLEAARGNFSEAARLFRQTANSKFANPSIHAAAYLAQARNGSTSTDEIKQIASTLTATKWPDSQVFYAAGLIDRNAFEATMTFGNRRAENARRCRGALVEGQAALIAGEKTTAKQDFARAVSLCQFEPGGLERVWAAGELARL